MAHALAALVAVGAGAFYAGYRYGLTKGNAGAALPPPPTATGLEKRPQGKPSGTPPATRPSTEDPHFQPRTVEMRTENFLANAGFEEGDAGWKWLDWSSQWGRFEVGEERAATGSRAAHLAVHGSWTDASTRVFGVVQEIVSPVFPTRISGRYFVERWEPGQAKKAYVQVVIIAMQAQGSQPTMQLRYILEGVTVQPYQLSNARYVFVHRREQPDTGTWIDFSLDVQEDCRTLWGAVPPDGTGYRVLFEARFDDKPPAGTVAIDVWYDELFVGVH